MNNSDDMAGEGGVREAAIAWLVRTRSDQVTDADYAALTDWLEASPAHLEAFEAVEALDAEIDAQAPMILAALTQRPPPAPAEVLPFRPRTPAPARRAVPRGAIAAGVAALAVTVGLGVWNQAQGPVQVYRTGPGQTRDITLADGSRIRLDAASTMKVRLGWFSRKVQLNEAVASFDVAHDPSRPFDVGVADQRVRVVGTEFNIRDWGGQVNITVRRGIVAVYQPGQGDAPIARLTKGWSLSHTVGADRSVTTQVNPDNAFAWSQGRMVCDGQSVDDIVSYLNRRYPTAISVAPSASGRRFTGVLELDDEDAAVRHLAAFLSLTAHRSARGFDLD